MKSPVKWIVRVVLVVVVLAVALAAGLYFYADSVAKQAVQRGGTYATGVDTTVDNVSLGLLSGEAGLKNFKIDNPPGFERDYFLRLGEAELAVGLGSLMSDVIRVPRIHLTDIDLNLEHTGDKPNYQVILDNLERLSSGETQPPPDQARQWIVDDLQVRNVHVVATVGGLASNAHTVELTLPQIVLEDVRSDSLAELQGQVIKQILRSVIQQAGQQLPGIMTAELTAGIARVGDLGEATLDRVSEATQVISNIGGELGAVGEQIGDRVNEAAGKAIDDARGNLDNTARDVTRRLGGLLGGQRNDEPADTDANADANADAQE